MKPSNYNFFLFHEQDCFVFNALTVQFFKIDKKYSGHVATILNHPNEYLNELPAFITKLKMNGFICQDDEDEFEKIDKRRQEKVSEKDYKLIILPTLGCNFRCWYCIQNHQNERMSVVTVNRIKKHILYAIEYDKMKKISLDWFGGEPFLCLDDVIEPLSAYTLDLCKTYHVEFQNTTTTNGFLLNEKIICKLKNLKFTFFQITLDGDKEYHDKTRIAKSLSSFDRIIKNVNSIVEIIPDAQVALRINYDDQNIRSGLLVNQLDELIPSTNRARIKVNFRKVWQAEVSNQTKKMVDKMKRELKDKGFITETIYSPSFLSCYVSKKYQVTIAPNGGIYKCTALEDYTTKPYGYINEEGEIIWKTSDFYENYISYSSIDNAYCRKCKYLPLCMGDCHRRYEKNDFLPPENTCNRSPQVDYETDMLKYCLSFY